MPINIKAQKAYVLYANEAYFDTVSACVQSIKTFSDVPIIVYMLNSKLKIEGALTINWECDVDVIHKQKYIDRTNDGVYNLLIQRPLIVKDALQYAEIIAYIDADSVATKYVDNIFSMFKKHSNHPYFVEGIYEYLHFDGRGGADSKNDLSTTLEHPACELFDVNQYVRERYRQTGYFVVDDSCISFLEEWWDMCTHPEVLASPAYYAPYHEETIANVLLWKYNIQKGLPYLYVNGSIDTIDEVYNIGFNVKYNYVKPWFKIPKKESELLFFHGEKDSTIMNKMIAKLKEMNSDIKIISNFPNYTININGDVINIKTNKRLKQTINQKRVLVELWKNNKKTHQQIHRLLAQAFIPNPDNKPQINHIDGNPSNNNINNLEWVTDSENKHHAYENNLIVQEKFPVSQFTLSGKFIKNFESILEASKFTKVDRKSIKFNIEGKYKQAGGFIWKNTEKRLKILFLPSHLSTGGMPAFVLKTIQALGNSVEIFVVEYQCHSLDFVVQRNAIKEIVGDNFKTLYENKMELFDVISNWNPDIIHIHDCAERLDRKLITKLYNNDRTYHIIETCHDVSFKPDVEKIVHPDYYAFCTPYHLETFAHLPSKKELIEFPIDPLVPTKTEVIDAKWALGMHVSKYHVVNIGLWTSGKNQGEMLELAKKMPDVEFHFVGNQAGNFKDYWEPLMSDVPKNVTIWGERDDTDVFMKAADVFMFNSTWECNPLVLREAISYNKKIIARNLPQYKDMFTPYITNLNPNDLENQLREVLDSEDSYDISESNTTEVFKTNLLHLYEKTFKSDVQINDVKDYNIIQHFVGQPFLEITGTSDSVFTVEFYDHDDALVYRNKIKCNHWVRVNKEYFTEWKVLVYKDEDLVYNTVLDYTNKKVYISFESASLGDTIAWIPYALEFKKKHNCHVIVSTFKNFLFESVYPELEFVVPGTIVNNLQGMYKIGWFYDDNKEPIAPNTIPLQQTATNILGLDYQEIKPRIEFTPRNNSHSKYVTIATNSTAGCKFWTKEGWQEVINFLVNKGYRVINVSKEKNPFHNCTQLEDNSMDNTINTIYYSEFTIALSSGLGWLAWALEKKVIMIAGFTTIGHEFQCIRPYNDKVCHGCWNKAEFKFDKGDWSWCPINKGTPDQFICQRSITAEMVINEIKKLI